MGLLFRGKLLLLWSFDHQMHRQSIFDPVLIQGIPVFQNLPGKDQNQLILFGFKPAGNLFFKLEKRHFRRLGFPQTFLLWSRRQSSGNPYPLLVYLVFPPPGFTLPNTVSSSTHSVCFLRPFPFHPNLTSTYIQADSCDARAPQVKFHPHYEHISSSSYSVS